MAPRHVRFGVSYTPFPHNFNPSFEKYQLDNNGNYYVSLNEGEHFKGKTTKDKTTKDKDGDSIRLRMKSELTQNDDSQHITH